MYRGLCAIALAAAVMLGLPGVAWAAGGWAWPVSGDPALSYGQDYAGPEGDSRTHGGLDIASRAGSAVVACAAGEVLFAGLVPAGEGARSWAVTVLAGDGIKVTYLPLASVDVRRGRQVGAGEVIGVLAAAGDASSDAPHLHLGVKRGTAPLDPLTLLGPRGISTEQPPVATEGPTRTARPPVSGSPAALARAPVGAAAPVGSSMMAGAGSGAAALAGALRTLAQTPALARVERIAAPTSVNLARVRADFDAARGVLLSGAVRIGLFLLALGCAWPVLRSMRVTGLGAAPIAVPARRGRG